MAGDTYRRPESVLVVVYSRDGRVLVLRRRAPFDFWQSVTGSLWAAETPVEAAQRELYEETGLTDEGTLIYSGVARQFSIDPRWQSRYAPGIVDNVEYEWRYEVDGTVDVTLADDEHSHFQWLPLEEAVATVWSWTNKEAIRTLAIR